MPPRFDAPLRDEYAFASRARERLIGVSIVNLTPAVHALLEYLAEHDFELAPKPLGMDDAGREI